MNESEHGVIFDLDGTLLDTLKDLAESMNHVLEQQGWPRHPLDAYRGFVGDGMPMLVRRALPPGQGREPVINECVQAMREEYERRWARTTRPYPGVNDLLRDLARRKTPMAVLTNKPEEAARKMVRHFFADAPFQAIAGARPDRPRKPDPTAALEIAANWAIHPRAILFVGDSNTDMLTARAAGMAALGAGWGFRGSDELRSAGAVQVLETPLELLNRLR